MAPNSSLFDLKNAEKFLKFAIQLTPQYGDSFIELMRLYIIKDKKQELLELKRLCIHSEPNYGIMWFFFKRLGRDSALDIWNQAEERIRSELNQKSQTSISSYQCPVINASKGQYFWTGCCQLNQLYSSGQLRCLDYKKSGLSKIAFHYERWRNIYGFEQLIRAKSGRKTKK